MPLLFESRRMSCMPKRIDPELKARAVRLVSEHRGEYPTLTAASQTVVGRLKTAWGAKFRADTWVSRAVREV
jgi:hypothetical protein